MAARRCALSASVLLVGFTNPIYFTTLVFPSPVRQGLFRFGAVERSSFHPENGAYRQRPRYLTGRAQVWLSHLPASPPTSASIDYRAGHARICEKLCNGQEPYLLFVHGCLFTRLASGNPDGDSDGTTRHLALRSDGLCLRCPGNPCSQPKSWTRAAHRAARWACPDSPNVYRKLAALHNGAKYPNDTTGTVAVHAPEERRFVGHSIVERVYSRLKDEFGARLIRVRGGSKIIADLMFGVLAFTG